MRKATHTITLEHFLSEVKRFNREAMYFLQIPVNIKSTISTSDENSSIDRVFAICPIKETLYTENFECANLDVNLDCLKDISFDEIADMFSEEELAQIIMQLKCDMFELSVADYEAHYNCKAKEVETELRQLMLTVACEIDCTEDFDIDELTIDTISFSNSEVHAITQCRCDIAEEV